MTQLKQRTVEGQTVTLHRLVNNRDRSRGEWMYEVRVDGAKQNEVLFNKRHAEQFFREVVKGVNNAQQREASQKRKREKKKREAKSGFGLIGGSKDRRKKRSDDDDGDLDDLLDMF